jgi:hypothetical protein
VSARRKGAPAGTARAPAYAGASGLGTRRAGAARPAVITAKAFLRERGYEVRL